MLRSSSTAFRSNRFCPDMDDPAKELDMTTTAMRAVTEFQDLHECVADRMRHYQVPGVAVGIIHDGEEHVATFGVTNVAHPQPVDADTLFQIGSTTKNV